MTAEDRNHRMKWGQSVPAGWIADFNMTHRRSPAQSNKSALKSRPTADQLASQALAAARRRYRAEQAAKQDINIVLAVLVSTFLLVTGTGISIGIYLANGFNQPAAVHRGARD